MKLITSESNVDENYAIFENCMLEQNSSFVDKNEAKINVVLVNDTIVVGGAIGSLNLDWLIIEKLWLNEELQHQGLEFKILNQLEASALQKGCKYVHLDSTHIENISDYIENGYTICGEVCTRTQKDFKCLLRKVLVDDHIK